MHETVITNTVPQWTMILSHSPTLATPRPSDSILSQYLQTNSDFFTSKTTPQVLFKYFRKAGPLVSVRMNVDIGNKKRAAVVKYWNEKDANAARIKKNTLHSMLRSRPAFSLRTFDPHRLRYSVRRVQSWLNAVDQILLNTSSYHSGVWILVFFGRCSRCFLRSTCACTSSIEALI